MEKELESFILSNFERALTDGSIQPFYQPVVRTISGKLCSFEALARWVDTQRGVIPPYQFIPVLERERLIHKLDTCIIRQVCQRMRQSVRSHQTPIPVSVNLSRLDFVLCDIFTVVDDIASQFQIPHDFLYIEVTESIMAEQEEMRSVINRFRTAGYQIWMDDFGSGYSSLNVLKDFVFDEIKMDMRFLSSFNQRSRRILTAVVQMAKEINIHTLAEGVETKEQFLFLRNIGCEKVQGYFFGRPMPYDQIMAHLKATGVEVESPHLRRYYDDIGRVNLLSAVPFMTQQERDSLTSARQLNSIPLAILQVQKEGFSVLFCNAAFDTMAAGTGLVGNLFSQELIGVEQPFSLLTENVKGLLDSTRKEQEGRMVFISHEEYYEIQTRCIAQSREMYSVLMRLNNLSRAAKSSRTGHLDDGLRQVYALFERITLLNTETDTITPLYVATRENLVSKRDDINELAQEYAFRWIFPEDQKDYLDFINPADLEQRVRQSGRNHINGCFRTSVLHGQFQWKQYTVLRLEPGVYLYMIRNVHDQAMQFSCKLRRMPAAGEEEVLNPALLWKNLADSDLLRLFWKDRERRFRGASQAFLDYYGFDALEDILGKTDEDLHWHVRPDHYMNDEMLVIHEGLVTHNIPGRCIRNGENRDILASKMPIRDGNGQIQGLMGYFIDRELLTLNDSRGADTVRRDVLTGLLNARGLSEEARIYQDEYYLRNADFACIHVEIDDFRLLIQQYGYDFADKVMVEVSKLLKSVFGLSAAVGRFEGYEFVVYYQVKSVEEAAELRTRIRQAAGRVQDIDGVPLTLYLSVGYALFSEFENLDEMIKKAEARLLSDHTTTASNETLMNRARELFHLYDNLPIPFAVFRALKDDAGQVNDAILFYANKPYEHNSGHSIQEMLGKSTRMLFPGLDERWYRYVRRAACCGETVQGRFFFKPTQTDYYITASQVIRPGFCAITFQNATELESVMKQDDTQQDGTRQEGTQQDGTQAE